ncbi:MAG: tyrosine-type recombinase/integrase, partial [Sphaerochaeta sp.]
MIPHQVTYEFHSVFEPSIREYLAIKESLGEKITLPGNILRQFDRYCSSIELEDAVLTTELAEDWLLTKAGEKPETRASRISVLWCFARHFSANGGKVTWRPTPGYAGRRKRYVPYIYTKEDVKNIFTASDAMPKSYGKSRFNVVFPAVIRILYGCGLRIAEALSLRVEDVDLENGFIFIHAGKFGKDRRIPISDSLLQYLKGYYKDNSDFIGIASDGWFFPNAKGECYSQRTVYDKFRQILWIAGISHQGKGKGPRVHD